MTARIDLSLFGSYTVPVYHEMKQLPGKEKGTWWKAIVRLVDQKGQGLYAEIRGSSESSVRKRAQEFYQPKFTYSSN